jgi:hypothetical protein
MSLWPPLLTYIDCSLKLLNPSLQALFSSAYLEHCTDITVVVSLNVSHPLPFSVMYNAAVYPMCVDIMNSHHLLLDTVVHT